ncbi:uncharacterized protein CDAR_113481 [Caerostris darwini]|uniref:Uncharacterized protein n=1 Tax=Caerostris darwini TaxID=1538125 RepID=A0AAV4R3L4_9ARAC|nr:uncharacterized protein CDAR_113481 [Caerostris darwini]
MIALHAATDVVGAKCSKTIANAFTKEEMARPKQIKNCALVNNYEKMRKKRASESTTNAHTIRRTVAGANYSSINVNVTTLQTRKEIRMNDVLVKTLLHTKWLNGSMIWERKWVKIAVDLSSKECIPRHQDCTAYRHRCCRSKMFKDKCLCFYKEGNGTAETEIEKCTCQQVWYLGMTEEVSGKAAKLFKLWFG